MTSHLSRSAAVSLLLLGAFALSARGDEASGAGAVQADVQASGGDVEDPWEAMNRPVFAFNEGVDRIVLEPVATGWDKVVPEPVQECIGNFFDHLQLPVRFANDVLQGKPRDAYETAWRAVINSVVGLGGLFDPASHWEVHESDEDFGQTLGTWGVPPGPYWVLPLLGPSNPRDAAGMLVDRAAAVAGYFVPVYVSVSAGALDIVNARAAVLEDIRAERESAFDFYSFVRSSYIQYRENRVRDRVDEPDDQTDDEDLYYFDEEDDDA